MDDERRGRRLGRYRLFDLIDRGGMGAVYRAHDERLDRPIALKVLAASAEAGQRERVLREARAAASLDHPGIVAVFDVGEATDEVTGEESSYIAMELVRGESLRAYVGRGGVALERRVLWLRDVADALAFAHARGVVHRDVKPENVMVREDGVVKVLDFGIARRERVESGPAEPATLTEKGMVLGTPRYMAPEQMLGEDLDGRADQFAWGVLGYELLTGRAPWGNASSSLQTVAEMLLSPHAPLVEQAPDAPPVVAHVVERAMQRARRDRYASMAEVVADLDAWLSAPTAHAKTSPRPRARVDRPVGTRGTKLVAAGVAVALVAAVGYARRSPAHPEVVARAPVACVPKACAARLREPAVCGVGGVCVPLASPECHVVSDPRDDDDARTVWLGAMFPLTGPDAASFGVRELRAVELARREVASVVGGAKAGLGEAAHGVALLACDDATAPERAAQHLVDVGVPAVVGFRSSQEAIDLASSVFVPRGVLVLSSLNTSPMLTEVPQSPGAPRLVWRTAIASTQTAVAAAAVVPEILEPELRAHGLGPRAPIRVATVRQDDPAGRGFADAFFRALRLNGRPAVDDEADYREIVVPFEGANDPSRESAVDGARKFAPNVIVYFGADEAFARYSEDVERAWPAGALRPRWLKPAFLGPTIAASVGRDADRRRRIVGLTARSSSVANARFVERFNDAYLDHVTRTFAPNSSYDAFYALAYATYAAPDQGRTGASLARAFQRLVPPGTSVEVGPEGIFAALDALIRGGNVDLEGATGHLDFDPETGEARVDLAVLCLGVGARGTATEGVESGAYFDARSNRLTGTMACR